MQPYLTVARAAEAEQSIDRSRFIGFVCPADSVETCEAFFDSIRRAHRQATHNVPAYVLGDAFQLQWAGDDGEPRGTSGAPIVHMLVNEGVSDVAVMVTRYFGGIKLGTGGLVRAYTSTARMAVEAAGFCVVCERLVLTCEMDYAAYNRVAAAFVDDDAVTLANPVFLEQVRVELVLAPESRETALSRLHAVAPRVDVAAERLERAKLPQQADASAAM
jgi:uncharacterized YigZ family protein